MRTSSRSGFIYLLALLVVLVVSGVAVVMSRGVGLRLRADQNATARSQCRQAALGVLRATLNDLDASMIAGRLPGLVTVKATGETVGDCTVLLVGRDPAGLKASFGLIPEAGKIGVNSLVDPTVPAATRSAQETALASLDGMTAGIAASIKDWMDSDDTPDANGGAERTDGAYLGAAVSYAPRNAPLETLEELRLVKGVSDALYFGQDANSNGRTDAGESGATLGLRDLLTFENREPSNALNGTPRVACLSNRGTVNVSELKKLLTQLFNAEQAAVLSSLAQKNQPYANRLELCIILDEELDAQDLDQLWPCLIGPEGRVGLVDAWACHEKVLTALIGSDLAKRMIAARPATPPEGASWLTKILSRSEAAIYGRLLTSGSYQFRADLLAVRNDGAGWARLEALLDCSSGTALVRNLRPAESLGWPLPGCTPDQLRRRQPDSDPATLLTSDTH